MHRIAEMVAGIRLDEVEHRMQLSPKEYPEYSDSLEAERIITQNLIKKYGMDKVKLNQLVSALSAQGAAIGVEMYIAGFLDGGHVAMAFHNREVPSAD